MVVWLFLCAKMLHEKVYSKVLERLEKAYKQIKIGDPLEGKWSKNVEIILL